MDIKEMGWKLVDTFLDCFLIESFNRNLERISRKIFQHLVKSDSESEFPDKDLVSI